MDNTEIRLGRKRATVTNIKDAQAAALASKKTRSENLSKAVLKTPEAMVKVTGYPKGSSHRVKEHINYISKNGALSMELPDGTQLNGPTASTEITESWKQYIGRDQEKDSTKYKRDRKAVSIVISSPKGTDPEKLREAVAQFGKEYLSKTTEYAFGIHTNTANPHAHIVIPIRGFDGKKHRIDRNELQHMREQWAKVALEHGIVVTATTRQARGAKTATAIDTHASHYWLAERAHAGKKGGIYTKTFQRQFAETVKGTGRKLGDEKARSEHHKALAKEYTERASKDETRGDQWAYLGKQHDEAAKKGLTSSSLMDVWVRRAKESVEVYIKTGDLKDGKLVEMYARALAEGKNLQFTTISKDVLTTLTNAKQSER